MTQRVRTRTSGIRRKKRPSGDVFEVRFRDAEGVQRSRTFPTMDQAKAFQTATLLDVRDGTYVPPTAGVVPFRVVAEQWFVAQVQLKRRTQITYRSAIDHNLAPLHDKPVGKITYGDVQAIVTAMTAAGRRPSTVRNVLMVCRLVLDDAVRRKFIRTNPCRDVKPPRLRPKDNVFLTVEQVQALAEQLPPPLNLLVLTAAGSGLRAGELHGVPSSCAIRGARNLHVHWCTIGTWFNPMKSLDVARRTRCRTSAIRRPPSASVAEGIVRCCSTLAASGALTNSGSSRTFRGSRRFPVDQSLRLYSPPNGGI